ncbi:MAG: UPF0179 family protein [Promethearchaeota archaeon]
MIESIHSNKSKIGKKEFVSFVGKSYSYKGFKFYFSGPKKDICPSKCRFFNTCMMNLEPNKSYEVVESMNVEHNCPMNYHLEPMVLVKLKEMDYIIMLESRKSFIGSVIRYYPLNCSEKEFKNCKYKKYCHSITGLRKGEKIKIKKVIKKIKDSNCQKGLNLVEIEKLD